MFEGLTLNTLQLALLAYALLINLLAFAVFGLDKWKARGGRRRVPEARLLMTILCGGILGAWIGMALFRHKTQKTSFRIKAFLASAVCAGWIALAFGYWLR